MNNLIRIIGIIGGLLLLILTVIYSDKLSSDHCFGIGICGIIISLVSINKDN